MLSVLQIYNGFQSRMRSTLLTLYDAVNRNPVFSTLPAVEFVIDISDGVSGCSGLPIFMMATRNSDCITVPDFTFGSWPESSCPPGQESHTWSFLYNRIGNFSSRFTEKANGLVWSGAETGRMRTEFLAVYPSIQGSVPDHIDVRVQVTKWKKNTALAPLGDNQASNCITLEEACRYKYQIYLPGNTYSSSLKYKMMCGSVVMAAFDEWKEWWYQAIEDNVNILHVDHTHKDDIVAVLNGSLTLQKERALAVNAKDTVMRVLSPESIACYWEKVLTSIAWGAPVRSRPGVSLYDVLMMDLGHMHFSVVDESEC